MILVIAVALWMVWVAPYVLQNRRYQLQPAVDFLVDVTEPEPADPPAGRVLKMMSHQENAMTSSQRIEPAKPAASGGGTAQQPVPVPAFRIRYGRLALALAGVLSLLTGVISAALRVFGLGSAWLPVVAFLGTAAAFVLLRRLAVRDRRRKVDRAFHAAMSANIPHISVQPPAPQPVPKQNLRAVARDSVQQPESQLFDAQSGDLTPEPAPLAAPRVLTGQELRQAALAEAAASGDTSVRLSPEGSSWEPVEVPKPTYVEAPKAERAAPGPLDLPEAPKAAGKPSLKQGLSHGPSRALSSEAAGLPEAGAGKSQSALSNLDDVLQRRRA